MAAIEPRLFRPQMYWYHWTTKLDFHPAAEDYPLMTDAQLAEMVEDMKTNGFDENFPIALLEGKIIRGRDRYRAAKAAKTEFVAMNLPAGSDPEKCVVRENELRKHFTPDYLHQKRQARIDRVLAARASGDSTRTIAENEGVSQGQVRRDIEDAKTAQVSPPDSPEDKSDENGDNHSEKDDNPKIVGKDGKTYKPRKEKKPKSPRKIKDKKTLFSAAIKCIGQVVRAVDDLSRGESNNRFAQQAHQQLQLVKKTLAAWEKAC